MQVLQKTLTIVRYQHPNRKVYYGIVEGDEIVQLSSDFTEIVQNELKYDGSRIKYSDVKILEPVMPSKIINFGWTYAGHATETGGKANLKEPFLFLKPTTSLVPDHGEIILPPSNLTNQVELEGEVALVIGKRGKNVKEEDALDYVAGYTITNDVTYRDIQRRTLQWLQGKTVDGSAPMGPYLLTSDELPDPSGLSVVLTVNGEVRQQTNTANLVFSVQKLVAFLSNLMTLEPGDVILTGTPGGVGVAMNPPTFLKDGDIVRIEIDKVGALENKVAAANVPVGV